MLIQEQLPWTHIDDENLSIFKAIGVDYVTINAPPPDLKDGADRADFWKEMSRRVDSNGMKLDNVGMNCWMRSHLPCRIETKRSMRGAQ